jgi:uncharacterized protein (TIGR03000 family)
MTPLRIACCSAVAALALGASMAKAEGGLSGALVGYTSGSQLDRRPLVPAQAYSASPYVSGWAGSLVEPIFMTTINTPGIYGAYSFGVAPLTLLREPTFYPVYQDRQVIPAITVTVAPVRDATTADGVATLRAALPSTLSYVQGEAGVGTISRQMSAVLALTSSVVPGENVARVVVRVPEDARLEFGGVPVEQPGRVRKFTTPALVVGQKYRYDIRASWTDNGQPVVKERQITIMAGEKADVDFLGYDGGSSERELRTLPPPRRP